MGYKNGCKVFQWFSLSRLPNWVFALLQHECLNENPVLSLPTFLFFVLNERESRKYLFNNILNPLYLLLYATVHMAKHHSNNTHILCLLQDVSFTKLDTSGADQNGRGLLHAVENLLSGIFIPALKKLENGWGQLNNQDNAVVRADFLNSLDSFVSVLVGESDCGTVCAMVTISGVKHCCREFCSLENIFWMIESMNTNVWG